MEQGGGGSAAGTTEYHLISPEATITVVCGGHGTVTLGTAKGEFGCCPACGCVFRATFSYDVHAVGGVGIAARVGERPARPLRAVRSVAKETQGQGDG